MALNIFPVSMDETAVIFSFTGAGAGPIREYVLASSGDYQKYLISRMLLHAENFVVAPAELDT